MSSIINIDINSVRVSIIMFCLKYYSCNMVMYMFVNIILYILYSITTDKYLVMLLCCVPLVLSLTTANWNYA